MGASGRRTRYTAGARRVRCGPLRLACRDRRTAERKRADDKIDGLAQAVQRVGSQIDELSKVKAAPVVASAPEVKEVVKIVQPEPPARATIGVFRGVKLETYDVPRQR